MFVSNYLVFYAEKVLNPISTDVLESNQIITTAAGQNGKALFNFSAIRLSNRKQIIRHIDASISENYSTVNKNSQPIVEYTFYAAQSNSLNFLKSIPEFYLSNTQFSFNDINLNSHIDCDTLEFDCQTTQKIPNNIIKFDCVFNPLDPTFDYELIYLPKPVITRPSIVDTLKKIYSFSFKDTREINLNLEIPSQANFLLVFPFVTIPVPPNRVLQSGTTLIRTGNIAVKSILNLDIQEF